MDKVKNLPLTNFSVMLGSVVKFCGCLTLIDNMKCHGLAYVYLFS